MVQAFLMSVSDTILGINGIQTGIAIVLPGAGCTARGTGNGNTKDLWIW